MIKFILLVLCVVLTVPLAAQVTDLHGKIQLNTSAPLEGVHKWLYNLADTTKPYMTSSTINGLFHLLNGTRGVYRFEVHSVGYTKITQVIQVK